MQKESIPLAITAGNTTFHAADSFLLRRPAEPVYQQELHSDDLKMLVEDLLNVAGATTNLEANPNKRTMVGLHARQLGYDKNVFVFWSNYKPVIERTDDYTPNFRVIINPQITYSTDTMSVDGEGCFSIDNVGSTSVPRPEGIRFSGLEVDIDAFKRIGDLTVNQIEEEAISEPYIARIFQHEEDHGRGIRFPAVATRLNRKGIPDEQIPESEEEAVRAMSQPLPYGEPKVIVKMKSLNAS